MGKHMMNFLLDLHHLCSTPDQSRLELQVDSVLRATFLLLPISLPLVLFCKLEPFKDETNLIIETGFGHRSFLPGAHPTKH